MNTIAGTTNHDMMRAALTLARRGLGRVWPNPAVGCVLTRPDLGPGAGRVVGRGWTQPGGRPHAETVALAWAGDLAKGATAYVTLEPCSHWGKTPPCAEALIAATVKHVVVALEDPDPRVAGKGIAALRAAGIDVTAGLLGDEAAALNAGYLLRQREGRPMITLKMATTLDGRIATHLGESQWITGEVARSHAHGLRADHDAVMVGIGTALTDDPHLTCRLPGLKYRSPVRIVLDPRLQLPLGSKLVSGAAKDGLPTWLMTLTGADRDRIRAYRSAGIEVIEVPHDSDHRPNIDLAVKELGTRGLTRVLVEGGGHLAAALLRRGLVDRLHWFRAPSIMGGDGVPVAVALGVEMLADAPRFVRQSIAGIAEDGVETYIRRD